MSGVSPKEYTFSAEPKELPKGKYLVIDPCYIIGGDPFWGEMCNWSYKGKFQNGRPDGFYIQLGKHTLFVWNTAYGDGCYPASDGNTCGECGVDAGLLSLVPMGFVKTCPKNYSDTDRPITELGTVLKLDEDSTPEVDNGNLTCGNISVITGDGEDD